MQLQSKVALRWIRLIKKQEIKQSGVFRDILLIREVSLTPFPCISGEDVGLNMISRATSSHSHLYVFDAEDILRTFRDQVYREVIRSAAFRRLKSINFLGAIDYLLPIGAKRPKKRHSRYQHSLAVGSLALHYCNVMGLSHEQHHYCVVAALLHDIGHAPLSHSLEPVFRSQFEIDHHISGERIIRGDVPIGLELSETLEKHHLNNFRVMSIIEGKDEPIYNVLFSHSINVDTIEAILRCATYLYDSEYLSGNAIVEALAVHNYESEEILDAFWDLKETVYSLLIQSRTGIMADFLCKRYMEVNASQFKESYYYGTESQLRKDHGRLFEALNRFAETRFIPDYLLPAVPTIHLTRRSFYIDSSVRLTNIESVDKRYRSSKKNIEYTVKERGGGNEGLSAGKRRKGSDLFP